MSVEWCKRPLTVPHHSVTTAGIDKRQRFRQKRKRPLMVGECGAPILEDYVSRKQHSLEELVDALRRNRNNWTRSNLRDPLEKTTGSSSEEHI